MNETDSIEYTLEEYKTNLEKLVRAKSDRLFRNGGITYASVLMSVLFASASKMVRIFCYGFKPKLITTPPYWNALIDYLQNENKELHVLVETDEALNERPLQLLKKKKEIRLHKDTIIVKLVTKEDIKKINETISEEYCNFAIFDSDKFRFEYDPEDFKAFGSFNRPSTCKLLTELFDSAFNNPKAIVLI